MITLNDIEAAAKHYSEVIETIQGMDDIADIFEEITQNEMDEGICWYFYYPRIGEYGSSDDVGRELGLQLNRYNWPPSSDYRYKKIHNSEKRKHVLQALIVRRDWLQNKAIEMKSNQL